MKRVLKICVVILCMIVLTGCGGMSNQDRDSLISELTKNNIIDKSWELVDSYEESLYSMEWRSTKGYGYIYKDKNGGMYEIYISPYQKNKDNENVSTSAVVKIKVTSVNNNVKTYDTCPNKCFAYKDGTRTEESKYIVDENSLETYEVTKTKSKILFIDTSKYSVEKK